MATRLNPLQRYEKKVTLPNPKDKKSIKSNKESKEYGKYIFKRALYGASMAEVDGGWSRKQTADRDLLVHENKEHHFRFEEPGRGRMAREQERRERLRKSGEGEVGVSRLFEAVSSFQVTRTGGMVIKIEKLKS